MTEKPTPDPPIPDEPARRGTKRTYPPVNELLELAEWAINATTPDERLATQPRDDNLDIALAAAARSRRLLMGLVAIVRADLPDVAGLLLRAIYEHWLVGAYALFGGADARQRLFDQQDHGRRTMAPYLDLPDVDSMPKGRRLFVSDLAVSVTELLQAENSETAKFAEYAYRTVYAAESAVSTHGGIESVQPYIADPQGRATILSEPLPKDPPLLPHRLVLATQLVVSSAQMPAFRYGLPHEELDRLAFAVVELDRPQPPA